jgi:hypothetical protein
VLITLGGLHEGKARSGRAGHTIDLGGGHGMVDRLFDALAKLYALGVRFNPTALYSGRVQRLALPTYPFERVTYEAPLAPVDDSEAAEASTPGGVMERTIERPRTPPPSQTEVRPTRSEPRLAARTQSQPARAATSRVPDSLPSLDERARQSSRNALLAALAEVNRRPPGSNE